MIMWGCRDLFFFSLSLSLFFFFFFLNMWAFTCIDVYPNKIWERRICGYFLFFSHYLGQYCRQESWPSRLESSVCRLFLINHDMVYMFFFWLSFASAVRMSLSNWFSWIWPCNFSVEGVQVKALVVVGNGAWDWANPDYLIDLISCSFQRYRI